VIRVSIADTMWYHTVATPLLLPLLLSGGQTFLFVIGR